MNLKSRIEETIRSNELQSGMDMTPEDGYILIKPKKLTTDILKAIEEDGYHKHEDIDCTKCRMIPKEECDCVTTPKQFIETGVTLHYCPNCGKKRIEEDERGL